MSSLSVCLSVCLSVRPSVRLSVRPSVCLSVCLSVCCQSYSANPFSDVVLVGNIVSIDMCDRCKRISIYEPLPGSCSLSYANLSNWTTRKRRYLPRRCGDDIIRAVVETEINTTPVRGYETYTYCTTYIRTYTIHLRFNINSLSRDTTTTSQTCALSNFEPSRWRSSLPTIVEYKATNCRNF